MRMKEKTVWKTAPIVYILVLMLSEYIPPLRRLKSHHTLLVELILVGVFACPVVYLARRHESTSDRVALAVYSVAALFMAWGVLFGHYFTGPS